METSGEAAVLSSAEKRIAVSACERSVSEQLVTNEDADGDPHQKWEETEHGQHSVR